jgi:hypothetical protein
MSRLFYAVFVDLKFLVLIAIGNHPDGGNLHPRGSKAHTGAV